MFRCLKWEIYYWILNGQKFGANIGTRLETIIRERTHWKFHLEISQNFQEVSWNFFIFPFSRQKLQLHFLWIFREIFFNLQFSYKFWNLHRFSVKFSVGISITIFFNFRNFLGNFSRNFRGIFLNFCSFLGNSIMNFRKV